MSFDPTVVAEVLGLEDDPESVAGRSPVMAAPRTSWTAVELLSSTFAEPRWAVPGLLAEGVNLLAGPPKVGKSWLALNLAVAVSAGGKALGEVDVVPGDVLYLALEDSGRTLQSRLRKVLALDPPPSTLTLTVACERLAAGGYQRIAAWLDAHRDARLVIVDVLARVRDRTTGNAPMYDTDYAAMATLKALAIEYGVAILVVHHTRKMVAGDFLDEVSGSQGLAGAADSVLVLKRARGEHDAVLHVTGREVPEAAFSLRFHPDLGAWEMLDTPPADLSLGAEAARILTYVISNPAGVRAADVVEGLEVSLDTARRYLARLAESGRVHRADRGLYTPVPSVPSVPLRLENGTLDGTLGTLNGTLDGDGDPNPTLDGTLGTLGTPPSGQPESRS